MEQILGRGQGISEGAKGIAEMGGTTVGKTPIGALIEALQYTHSVPLPDFAWLGIWGVASATFAGNASGVVNAVIRNSGWIWTNIEKPILVWRNIPILKQ